MIPAMNIVAWGRVVPWADRGGKDAARSLHSDSSAPPRSGAGGRRRGRQVGPKAGSGERSGAGGSHWHT
jgi:hypothetical protein